VVNARSDVQGVFPVHLRTRKIRRQLGLEFRSHIQLIDPVGYFDMLRLEAACFFVMTDSGGVQKEAYFFGKPCMILRASSCKNSAAYTRIFI
jgi:UDP-GlcNAc3NAcA epimerase